MQLFYLLVGIGN